MDYQDFNIRFESKGGDNYKIRVESAAGSGSALIKLTHSIDEILAIVQSGGQTFRSSPAATDASPGPTREVQFEAEIDQQPDDVGMELYRDLFKGAAASKFNHALGIAQGTHKGLRIKLHIDPNDTDVARLGSLPWELLCHPDMGGDPLSLSGDTPVVRYLESPRGLNLKPFKPPLRVLVVVSDPKGAVELDLAMERASIEASWGNQPDVDVHFLEVATVQGLANELSRHDYHVLHYMGHGDFDEKQGVGVLLMENEDGTIDAVDGRTLGVSLQDADSLRLVFLNACNTAKLTKDEGKDPYAGVAPALVMAGIPSVVAMQFPISDRAAIMFAGCLYPRLVQGYPLDQAVTEARKMIRIADRKSLEWATPVLFMSSIDGRLFDIAGKDSAPTGKAEIPKPKTESAIARSRFCRKCGDTRISGAKFCRRCGAAFTA